jgi:hypothetical protein
MKYSVKYISYVSIINIAMTSWIVCNNLKIPDNRKS